MKKLLTLLFALAIATSLSFAQAATDTTPKKDDTKKTDKADKKTKKADKKQAKTEKKDDTKKEEGKK